ncbi:hypothetical protein [Xanthobacter agilis]|uniref:Uncharacterized protein n=1 Tax=Xanthobacter agilis TaxID=47492 RepID=A0ABU0LFH6_XANAG|nr:hypothetical protein [Xanthobacter agilis]MDQ0505899.1 hypothetical protein [Xanthobacter agilis]
MQAVARAFFHVPVVGWLLKDAVHGLPDAKYYFIFNLFVAFACLVYAFGYPFLIVSALTATATMLVSLIILTASDMFAQLGKRIGGGSGSSKAH